MTLELTAGPFVTRSGQPAGDMLRWPKNKQEKVDPVALLVGGELKGLPALKDLAAARLVFPIVRAHPKAPTRIGAAVLNAPFVPGKPYDFTKIGEAQGTEVVPMHAEDASNWDPPKSIKVDVTRSVRGVVAGEGKFNGFALRVVPDRGLDDGWTVRVQLPKQPKIYLEVDVYTDCPVKAGNK